MKVYKMQNNLNGRTFGFPIFLFYICPMKQEYLNTITQTESGYPVRNLRFLKVDNIIVGQVKDPVCGKETLHNGYISGQWTRKGVPTNSIKGREDLKLSIDLTQAL